MSLNKDLLEILACPKCKEHVTLTPEEDGLICAACGVVYPIENEIPVLLVEEAISLADWPEKHPGAAEKSAED
jgi:uncharacterized protein YbaR (Trm112 family)